MHLLKEIAKHWVYHGLCQFATWSWSLGVGAVWGIWRARTGGTSGEAVLVGALVFVVMAFALATLFAVIAARKALSPPTLGTNELAAQLEPSSTRAQDHARGYVLVHKSMLGWLRDKKKPKR